MRGVVEIALVVSLSLGAHYAVIAQWPDRSGGGAGAGGADATTSVASAAEIARLVSEWQATPDVSGVVAPEGMPVAVTSDHPEIRLEPAEQGRFSVPDAPVQPVVSQPPAAPTVPRFSGDAPERSDVALPPTPTAVLSPSDASAPRSAPDPTAAPSAPPVAPPPPPAPMVAPLAAAPPPPPTPETRAPLQSPRPQGRPARATQTPPAPAPTPPARATADSAPAQGRQAEGSGQGAARGTAPAPAAAGIGTAERQRLMSEWAAGILRRIERSRPRVSEIGAVVLRMTVSRNGTLVALGISRSSGNATVDQAAIQAVQRAGRFPAAPAALTEPSYAFSLPIRFQ